jgi:Leucine-rich repeat (LRR) protein
MMTDKQIKRGFWDYDPDNNHPPKLIDHPDKYQGEFLLRFGTSKQSDETVQENKKRVELWCSILPKLKDVKYLWTYGRTNQKVFDAICEMQNLEGLNVFWGGGVTNIDSLSKLGEIKHLHLASFTKVENIEVLGTLKSLETLELEHFNKITDFSVVSKLTQLIGLGIDGSIETAQKIDTLKPLRGLTKLKYLTATHSQIMDKSFESILGLSELVRFTCSWNYPVSEFEKLKSMPNLKYGNIETSRAEDVFETRTLTHPEILERLAAIVKRDN